MNDIITLNKLDTPVQFHYYACSIPLLEEKEERDLLTICKTNAFDSFEYKNALQKLVYHHMRYISKIALKIYDCVQSFKEIISEGIYGIIDAVKNFDMSKQVRFMTYAAWWIKYRIGEWIKARNVIKCCDDIISLNAPLSNQDDEEMTVEDTVKDESTFETYFEEDHNKGCSLVLSDALSCLNEREIAIVQRYNKGESLEKISIDYNISRERVRQINNRALEKMKKYLLEKRNITSVEEI